MNKFNNFIKIIPIIFSINTANADLFQYEVELVYLDDTVFRGTFDYDYTTQQILNLQGSLEDTLMGNTESIIYQLESKNDGKGGITAYAYAMNTKTINTNPPANNNVMVAINFNDQDPTLGPTDINQLAYMDCSPGGLMGLTCMYHLSWHNPIFPMAGGQGILSETIRIANAQTSRSDCLFDWAENHYPELFSPAGSVSDSLLPYYYRYYPTTNSYLGLSSDDNHVYYLGPDGNMLDVGHASNWLVSAGC